MNEDKQDRPDPQSPREYQQGNQPAITMVRYTLVMVLAAFLFYTVFLRPASTPEEPSAPVVAQESQQIPITEPAPEPEPEPESEPEPEPEPVPYSYFDQAVFIGDSITNQLGVYVGRVRTLTPDYMGTARFGGVAYYSVTNATSAIDSGVPHHVYKGETLNSANFIATLHQESPVARAYIMLGMNDINRYSSPEPILQLYQTYITQIQEKNPHLEIVLMSMTPVGESLGEQGSGKLNPTNISEFNAALKDLCQDQGYGFVDTFGPLQDEEGFLPDPISADGFHLNNDGYAAIVELLCDQAGGALATSQQIPSTSVEDEGTAGPESQEDQNPPAEEAWTEAAQGPLDQILETLVQDESLGLPQDLMEMHPMALVEQYGLEADRALELVAKQTASYGPGRLHTILLVKMASQEEASQIYQIFAQQIQGLLVQSKNYDLQGYALLEQSALRQDGTYVALFLTEEGERVAQAYLALLP